MGVQTDQSAGVRSNTTVLIADDSRVVRRNLRKLLTRLSGITAVLESCNVASTLDQIAVHHPDVIILDLQLPDGSGFEILEHFAGSGEWPVTMVLTNHASRDYREKAARLGAHYFFDKSFEYEQILDVLESPRHDQYKKQRR